jgi:hypothetical protein
MSCLKRELVLWELFLMMAADFLPSERGIWSPNKFCFNQAAFFSFFIVGLGGSTLWDLQKFLQYIECIILELTSSTILLYPSFPGIV